MMFFAMGNSVYFRLNIRNGANLIGSKPNMVFQIKEVG